MTSNTPDNTWPDSQPSVTFHPSKVAALLDRPTRNHSQTWRTTLGERHYSDGEPRAILADLVSDAQFTGVITVTGAQGIGIAGHDDIHPDGEWDDTVIALDINAHLRLITEPLRAQLILHDIEGQPEAVATAALAAVAGHASKLAKHLAAYLARLT